MPKDDHRVDPERAADRRNRGQDGGDQREHRRRRNE